MTAPSRKVALAALVVALLAHPVWVRGSNEPDELVGGTALLVRGPGGRVSWTARAGGPGSPFDLPDPTNDPTVEGATLRVFDNAGGAGDDTYSLPAAGWMGLGTPAGIAGFKYRGSGAASDPCRVVLVKASRIRAVCRGAAIALSPPFAGDAGVILTVGSDSKRYCSRFGGSTKSNVAGLLRRRAAPPAPCADTTTSTSTTSTTTTTNTTATSWIPQCNAPVRFTLTSSVGTIQLDNLPPFPLTAGIVTVLDVGPEPVGLPECRHDLLIPAGGFAVPTSAFGNTNYCLQISSVGCESGGADGRGALWDGEGSTGALTDVSKLADTSDGACNPAGQPCTTAAGGAGANTLGKIVTTWTANTGRGELRYAVDTRLRVLIWSDSACSPSYTPGCCAASTYDPADGDLFISSFETVATLTTGTATAAFADLNGDACKRAGSGFDSSPPGLDGPKSVTGVPAPGPYCVVGQSTTAVAAGIAFSGAAPFFDVGFRISVPSTVSACGAPASGSCVLTTDPCLGSPGAAFLDKPESR
jgi:hypothetical protein